MSHAKRLRRLIRIIVPFCLFLLLLIAGFQAIPLTVSNAQVIQADLQRTRCELIVKSVLILAYRPTAEHTQAISDLQVVLPLFEQEQAILVSYHSDSIQTYLLQAQPDYLAIIKATQNILAQKDKPVDMVQVNIILDHEQGYFHSMNELLIYGQQRLDARAVQVFSYESGIDALLLLIAVLFWIRAEYMIKQIQKEGA